MQFYTQMKEKKLQEIKDKKEAEKKKTKPEKEKSGPKMSEWIPPVLGKDLSIKTDLDK